MLRENDSPSNSVGRTGLRKPRASAHCSHRLYKRSNNCDNVVQCIVSDDASSIVVTWLTLSPAGTPTVQYGPQGQQPLPLTAAPGHTSSYTTENIVRYVHRVTLTGLFPDTKYGSLQLPTFAHKIINKTLQIDYQCGSTAGWSAVFTVKTLGKNSPTSWWSPTFLIYGDFGLENAQSLPQLNKEVNNGEVDAIFHIGDFGYDLFSVSVHCQTNKCQYRQLSCLPTEQRNHWR